MPVWQPARAQVDCHFPLSQTDCNGIPENLHSYLLGAVRRVDIAPRFNLAHCFIQRIAWLDSGYGHGPDKWENVLFQQGRDSGLGNIGALGCCLGQPHPRHRFKRVGRCIRLGLLFFTFRRARVNAVGQG